MPKMGWPRLMQPADYVVYLEGSQYIAINGQNGEVYSANADLATLLQELVDSLTAGTIWLRDIGRPAGVTLADNITIYEYYNGQLTMYGNFGALPYVTSDMRAIRLICEEEISKPIIEWVNNDGVPIAWIVAHYKLDAATEHKHIGIETPQADMATIRTRLAINYGVDKATVMVTYANFRISNASVSQMTLYDSGSTNEMRIMVDATCVYIGSTNAVDLKFQVGGATKAILTAGGNFGVNDDTPDSKLEVNGSFAAKYGSTSTTPTLLGVEDYFMSVDATGGAIVIDLPDGTSMWGRMYIVKKTDAGGNAVTVTPNGAQTIDGAATFVLATQYKYVHLMCRGSGGWYVMGSN